MRYIVRNIIKLIMILLICTQCSSIQDDTLNHTFEFIDNDWSSNLVNEFKNSNESEIGFEKYFFALNSKRTEWLNSEEIGVEEFFSNKGLYSEHDISLIVLLSYHRHLNNKELEVNSQLDFYLNRRRNMSQCQKEKINKSRELYGKFIVNDCVRIELPIEKNIDSSWEVISFDCTNLKNENNKILSVYGCITSKDPYFKESETIIEIEIDSLTPATINLSNDSYGLLDVNQSLQKKLDLEIGNRYSFSLSDVNLYKL